MSLMLIIAACIVIGIETNHEFYAKHYRILHTIDLIIITLFAFELVIRYVANIREYERVHGRASYTNFFRDWWHVLDVVIVIICLLPHSEFFAVLRTLRILRVFLLIDEIPRLKILVNALVKSIPSMAYVMLLLVLHFYAYAVIGTDIYGRSGVTHFATLSTSLLTLFQVVTGDGWSDIMRSVETTAPQIPEIGVALYFVSFIVIGAMIFLNLFIGVITNEIAELKANHDREQYLNKCSQSTDHFEMTIHQAEEQLRELQKTLAMIRTISQAKETSASQNTAADVS